VAGSKGHVGSPAPQRTPFRSVLRVRAFAVLYAAETQSIAGDQLARIALSVLVFERTNSAGLTALTYGVTYLPAILGGALLAGIGDRFSRRNVMIGCDVARALIFLVMAISGVPLVVLVCLLVLAVFVGPAFSAAEVTYLSSVLSPDYFRSATALRMLTSQLAQAVGFGVGGVLVATISPRGALVADAVSYIISASVVAFALQPDEKLKTGEDSATPIGGWPSSAVSALWRDRRLRTLVALSCLAGFFIVPEGLAVPFGHAVEASTAETGFLLASIPLGSAIGAVVLVRLVARKSRPRMAERMAVGAGLPLVITAFVPHWPVVLACWLLSGALAAYQIEVMTALVYAVPKSARAQLVGAASAALLGAQGLGIVFFGWIAQISSPGVAVASAGAVGSGAAAGLVVEIRHRRSRGADSEKFERLSNLARLGDRTDDALYSPRHRRGEPDPTPTALERTVVPREN
jgi:MFS family permease